MDTLVVFLGNVYGLSLLDVVHHGKLEGVSEVLIMV